VHWHTPSENTVDGKHFALEAHFVHQLDAAYLTNASINPDGTINPNPPGSINASEPISRGTQDLGVISVMYENTGDCDDTLSQVLCYAVLCYATLRCATLRYAMLC
jgi:hypothetical protein